jgi:hypothetical protein
MAFAALALLNTALMATAERRAKLGLVRLIGTTRRQARRMIAWEALIATLAGLAGTLVLAPPRAACPAHGRIRPRRVSRQPTGRGLP